MDSKIKDSYEFCVKKQDTGKIKAFLKLSNENICLILQI